MKYRSTQHNGIPISISLDETIQQQKTNGYISADKKRLLYISFLAVIIGIITSLISKSLVLLINLFTHLFFYHQFSFTAVSPSANNYGAQ